MALTFLLLGIESRLQAFSGNPLCGAVCMNCLGNVLTFENVKDDSRDVPKRLRNTLINQMLSSRYSRFA